jgi:hypothetical protein
VITVTDSSDLDAALITLLQTDATLAGLLADGIYFDIAPPNAKQFGVVSIITEVDSDDFGGRVFEDVLYMVKAVELSSVTTKNIKPAAARIDALLARAQFTAPGFGDVTGSREQRIRYTEVDDVDKSIRWMHRGGQYRVMATLTPSAAKG